MVNLPTYVIKMENYRPQYHTALWCEMHDSSPVGVGQVDYRARPSIF